MLLKTCVLFFPYSTELVYSAVDIVLNMQLSFIDNFTPSLSVKMLYTVI